MRRLMSILAPLVLSVASAEGQDRIVSIGGDLTEIVYLLGEEERLVATDTTSVFPPEARETPKVGYVRQLSPEGVLSVEPDLILVSGAAGPDAAVELLQASGVEIVALPADYTPESILRKIEVVSDALDVPERGAALRTRVEAEIAKLETTVAVLEQKPRILFFVSSNGAPRAAGADTAADGLIRMLGGENVFSSQTGYKPLSLEAAVLADPDFILVMAHNAESLGGWEAVRTHPALAMTKAAQTGRVLAIDAAKTMQFGPRTPEGISEIAARMAGAPDRHRQYRTEIESEGQDGRR